MSLYSKDLLESNSFDCASVISYPRPLDYYNNITFSFLNTAEK